LKVELNDNNGDEEIAEQAENPEDGVKLRTGVNA
jgi:hypothetical protein